MTFKNHDTPPSYYPTAERAATLECSGYYALAAKEWLKAGQCACHPFNLHWCQNRAEFCAGFSGNQGQQQRREKSEEYMTAIRERTLEKYLARKVRETGGMAYKLTVFGRRGVPDRLLLMPGGRLIFVECKAPGEKPRPEQLREHERLEALGFTVVVLDDKNLEVIF